MKGDQLYLKHILDIAVATVAYRSADHLMMVVFKETESGIVAISIHPLEERDVERKIRNGRWTA